MCVRKRIRVCEKENTCPHLSSCVWTGEVEEECLHVSTGGLVKTEIVGWKRYTHTHTDTQSSHDSPCASSPQPYLRA